VKVALPFVLGAAGVEFMNTIRAVLYKCFGISIGDAATSLLGIALGLILTIVFVILPEVKKDA
jgi:tetrahydromethanopterin S-methyltransferase subunit G